MDYSLVFLDPSQLLYCAESGNECFPVNWTKINIRRDIITACQNQCDRLKQF